MKKVDVFYVGTMRSGSTWLHSILSLNVDVSVSQIKETYFFDRCYDVKRVSGYEETFVRFDSAVTRVDLAPTYTEVIETIDRIIKYNKNAKFIFIFRNHVDLVISQYNYMIANGMNVGSPKEFWRALPKDKFVFGAYLKKLSNSRPAGSLLFLDFSEFKQDKLIYLNKVLRFIGVDGCPVVNLTNRVNTSDRIPRSPSVYSVFRRLGKVFLPFIGLRAVRWIRVRVDSVLKSDKLLVEEFDDDLLCEIRAYYQADHDVVLQYLLKE